MDALRLSTLHPEKMAKLRLRRERRRTDRGHYAIQQFPGRVGQAPLQRMRSQLRDGNRDSLAVIAEWAQIDRKADLDADGAREAGEHQGCRESTECSDMSILQRPGATTILFTPQQESPYGH